MPGINIWMIFQVFGIVSAWAAKALADGKITLVEAAELALKLGALLGIPTDVTLPQDQNPNPATPDGEAIPLPAADEDAHPKRIVT